MALVLRILLGTAVVAAIAGLALVAPKGRRSPRPDRRARHQWTPPADPPQETDGVDPYPAGLLRSATSHRRGLAPGAGQRAA